MFLLSNEMFFSILFYNLITHEGLLFSVRVQFFTIYIIYYLAKFFILYIKSDYRKLFSIGYIIFFFSCQENYLLDIPFSSLDEHLSESLKFN